MNRRAVWAFRHNRADDVADSEILFTSNDTFELLRILQEITSSAAFAPHDYLDQLAILLKSRANNADSATQAAVSNTSPETTQTTDLTAAFRRIEECRLALARNLARALVVGFDNPF